MSKLEKARQRIEVQREADRRTEETEWQRIEPFRKALLEMEDAYCKDHMPKRMLDLFYETCTEIEKNENEELIVEQIFWFSPSNIWPDNPAYGEWWNDPKRPVHYREYHSDENWYQNWTPGFKQELLNLWENGKLESAKIVGMTFSAHSKNMVSGTVRDIGYAKNYSSIFHVTITPELNEEERVTYKSIWCFGNMSSKHSIESGLSDLDISDVAEKIVQKISDRMYTTTASWLNEIMVKDQARVEIQSAFDNHSDINAPHEQRRRIEQEQLQKEQEDADQLQKYNTRNMRVRVLNELRNRADSDMNFVWPTRVPKDLRYDRSGNRQYDRYTNNDEFEKDLDRIFPEDIDFLP